MNFCLEFIKSAPTLIRVLLLKCINSNKIMFNAAKCISLMSLSKALIWKAENWITLWQFGQNFPKNLLDAVVLISINLNLLSFFKFDTDEWIIQKLFEVEIFPVTANIFKTNNRQVCLVNPRIIHFIFNFFTILIERERECCVLTLFLPFWKISPKTSFYVIIN